MPLDDRRQHLVHSVACRYTVLHVTLIRYPGQLGQGAVVASSHFAASMVLRSVYVMYVPSILVPAAPTPCTRLILVDLPSIIALCVHGVSAPNRASRVMLSIHQCHSRYRILLIVIAILVPSLDQFLLGFFQAEGSHQAITIVGYIDIGHITRIIHARFSLKMVMMACRLVD